MDRVANLHTSHIVWFPQFILTLSHVYMTDISDI